MVECLSNTQRPAYNVGEEVFSLPDLCSVVLGVPWRGHSTDEPFVDVLGPHALLKAPAHLVYLLLVASLGENVI